MSKIKVKTLRGYIQGISGVFITPRNPHGLSPKEIDILSALIYTMREQQTDYVLTSTRKQVAVMMDISHQVVTNYLKKFRSKQLLTEDNKLHPLLKTSSLEIELTV